MKESQYSKKLRDEISIQYPESHVYLIQDAVRTGRKPYDFYFAQGNRFRAVECKLVRGKTLNFSILLEHQYDLLDDINNIPVVQAYVSVWLHGYSNKMSLTCRINIWEDMAKEYGKSVKIEKLLNNKKYSKYLYNRTKVEGKTMWDMSELFNMVKQ